MPVLKTLVDPAIKLRFRAMAKARQLSESELLRLLVLEASSAAKGTDRPVEPDPENAELDRMTVRMPRFLVKAIQLRAKQKGMAPSRWVAALVQSNLTDLPVLNDDEINMLRTSNRELVSVGRNINQIARALNHPLQNSDRVPLDKLAALSHAVAANRDAISVLLRSSQNVWRAV